MMESCGPSGVSRPFAVAISAVLVVPAGRTSDKESEFDFASSCTAGAWRAVDPKSHHTVPRSKRASP